MIFHSYVKLPEGTRGYHSWPPGCHPIAWPRHGRATPTTSPSTPASRPVNAEAVGRWRCSCCRCPGSGGALDLWEVSHNYGKIVYIMRCHGMSWHIYIYINIYILCMYAWNLLEMDIGSSIVSDNQGWLNDTLKGDVIVTHTHILYYLHGNKFGCPKR